MSHYLLKNKFFISPRAFLLGGIIFAALIWYFGTASNLGFLIKHNFENFNIQSNLSKTAVEAEKFKFYYLSAPTEVAFIDSLRFIAEELGESCKFLDVPDYECLFKSASIVLPKTCDYTNWRSDYKGAKECYMRYYAGISLSGNENSNRHFRIYAKTFGDEGFYVYDSEARDAVFKCPLTMRDRNNLGSCKEL